MAVYFIAEEETDRVKIGHAGNVWQRLAQLQVDAGKQLILMRAIEGGYREEQAAHEAFAALRIVGEWFTYSDTMFDYGQTIDVGPAPVRRQRDLEHSWLIDSLGGNSAVCKLFNVGSSVVSNWRRRGVPGRYQYALAAHCASNAIAWSPPPIEQQPEGAS